MEVSVKDAEAVDGQVYSQEYVDYFLPYDSTAACPDAVGILGAAGEWEAAGFLTWLTWKSPRTCLEKAGGGSQLSRWFPAHTPGGRLEELLEEVGMSWEKASRLLAVLERHDLVWLVQEGSEVVALELRPPPGGSR